MSEIALRAPEVGHPFATAMEAERLGWYQIAELVRSLTPVECVEPGYQRNPDWTVRDLVAHLGTWLAEAEIQFERIRAGTYAGHDVDIDAVNAALLLAMEAQPFDVAWLQANAARTRMLQEWSGLKVPDDEVTWWVRKADADHYDEHLGRLREWTAELISRRPGHHPVGRLARQAAITPSLDEHWPELPWREWQPTVATLHRWLQIVGKVRMQLAPPLNHWWHVTLQVTPRGFGTGLIPYGDRSFEVDFDVIEHRLVLELSDGDGFEIPLESMSVAHFYRDFMNGLAQLDIEAPIRPVPTEVPDATPFATDDQHATYDPVHAQLLWQGFRQADRVLKSFQSSFVGKQSPVQLFWGSFDLALSRYSGRLAPPHPGGAPNCPDWVMVEAYSREETAAGWWPSSDEPGPSFYAYAYPEPMGYKTASVRPDAATYNDQLGEYMLPYDAVRAMPDPDQAVTDFLQSTYEAGADLGHWDRALLEPAVLPARPPSRPWSVDAKGASLPIGDDSTPRVPGPR
jgi:Family of unknown function (DUF5996)